MNVLKLDTLFWNNRSFIFEKNEKNSYIYLIISRKLSEVFRKNLCKTLILVYSYIEEKEKLWLDPVHLIWKLYWIEQRNCSGHGAIMLPRWISCSSIWGSVGPVFIPILPIKRRSTNGCWSDIGVHKQV